MKTSLPRLLIFLLISVCACDHVAVAQVQLSVRLEPSRAVQHESVMAHIRIRNNTAREIVLGDSPSPGRLWLDVEQSPGRTMRQVTDRLIPSPLTIPPRQSVNHRINVTSAYDIRYTGPYTVRARVNWQGRSYVSGGAFLEIVPGMEIRELQTSLAADGSGSRSYRLLTLHRNRGDHLFLRVDDLDADICYTVTHLGRLLRTQGPQMEIDGQHNVTILHQTAPSRFFYHVFSPNGEMLRRKIYTSETPAGVSLVVGDGGRFIVQGAASSLQEGDY